MMYFMNQMNLFSTFYDDVKNIFGFSCEIVVGSRNKEIFYGFLTPFLGSFLYIKYIVIAMRSFLSIILMLDVPYVDRCIYVMYKPFFEKSLFLLLWQGFSMYVPSTSMYMRTLSGDKYG